MTPAEYDNRKVPIDTIINNDPTLKAFLRDNEFSTENFDYQVDIMCAAIKIALDKWLDINY